MMNFYDPYNFACEKAESLRKRNGFTQLSKVVLLSIMLLLTGTGLYAQPFGNWDAVSTNGTAGSSDLGGGVYKLLSDVNTGCAGSSISETTNLYDPAVGNFSKCYQVYFGCPGNDNIGAGTDLNGDGVAFSFSKGPFSLVGNSCGGGLGYMDARADGKMITIEFDTYSSMGNTNFDAAYGGGTSGDHDELALHIGGIANDGGRLNPAPGSGAIVDAGNLEDGLEHTICITYNNTTHVLGVTIDGVSKMSYDLDITGVDFATYFGAGGLTQTWSSGKAGATNPTTVSDETGTPGIIASKWGGSFCPNTVVITSPTEGSVIDPCNGPITITASAFPPAGNTVTKVDFYVDGVLAGTDNSAPYSTLWTPTTTGAHTMTAQATFSIAAPTTSSVTNITVGAISLTSGAPTIDGTVDAAWGSYSTFTLTKGYNSPPDLAANYKIMYDATNLYVLVNVTDDFKVRDGSGGTWEDDGVELFIDIGNNKLGAYAASDFQFSFNWNSATIIENKWGNTTGVQLGQANTGGGYVMEMKLPWTTLGLAGAPSAGTNVGFEVKINDDDDSGTRDNELGWKDATFGSWNNPSLFGTLPISNCNPLPVELLTFTGKIVNETVVLNWSTASEVNNRMFIVERSADLIHWTTIGDVTGAGNTTSITSYSLTDYDPLDGIAYYRLRQIDIDGQFAFSNVVVIEMIDGNISISPNPFDNAFTIRSNIKGEMDVKIYDLLGRLLYQMNHKMDNGSLSVQPDLPSGAYFVTVQTETFIEQQKIIKK